MTKSGANTDLEPIWVSLFSGGKDSSYALWLAQEHGLPVERLLTVHPPAESTLYHVPGTELASLAAESIGIELIEVTGIDPDHEGTIGDRGDAEIEPIEQILETIDRDHPGGLAGIVAGAVESAFQSTRLERVCDSLDIEYFAPLWQQPGPALLLEMIRAGFEITIVEVAAAGFDETWLGRTLDEDALADLERLSADYGVHVLGEGGEFETIVTDGPHMDKAIEFEGEPEWDGTRGEYKITDAWLAE